MSETVWASQHGLTDQQSAIDDGGQFETLTTLGFLDDGPKRSLGRRLDIEGLQVNSKVVLVDPTTMRVVDVISQ